MSKKLPRVLEHKFVLDESSLIRIQSDTRGDECIIFKSKLDQVISIEINGMVEKEPILFIHFLGGATSSISFASRTCVQNALLQLINYITTK